MHACERHYISNLLALWWGGFSCAECSCTDCSSTYWPPPCASACPCHVRCSGLVGRDRGRGLPQGEFGGMALRALAGYQRVRLPPHAREPVYPGCANDAGMWGKALHVGPYPVHCGRLGHRRSLGTCRSSVSRANRWLAAEVATCGVRRLPLAKASIVSPPGRSLTLSLAFFFSTACLHPSLQ